MASSSIAGFAYFALLMVLAGPPDGVDPTAAVVVVGCAAALATTAALLLRGGAVVAPLPPLVHGLAYYPNAWAAVSHGTMWSGLFIHPESVRDGLLLMTGFTCATSVAGRVLGVTRPALRVGGLLSRLAAPAGTRVFTVGLLLAFGGMVVAAYRANAISLYLGADAAAQPEDGADLGTRVQYATLVGPFFVYSAFRLYEVISRRLERPMAVWLWLLPTAFGGLLLLVLQSRRLMLVSFLLLLTLIHRRLLARGAVQVTRSLLPVVSLGGALVLVAFAASTYWRSSTQETRAENAAQRAAYAVDVAQRSELTTSEVVTAYEQRLQYLAFEGACQQIFAQVRFPLDALDGLLGEAELVIPRALYPSKGDGNEVFRCGRALAMLGMRQDVACTATCNGAIIDGSRGVATAAVLWSVALAVGEALPATAVGIALVAIPATMLSQIETGFAPLFQILRGMLFLVLIVGSVGLVVNTARSGRRRQA